MTKKIFKILILFSALSSLSSCGSFSDAGKVLRNEKITNTDEFFIKKRAPLVLPPDYEKIPNAINATSRELMQATAQSFIAHGTWVLAGVSSEEKEDIVKLADKFETLFASS